MRDPILPVMMMLVRGHLQDRRAWRHRFAGFIFRNYPGLIDCATFERFLMDYYERTLAEPARLRVERHLALCGLCCGSYQGYVRSIELGKRLFETQDAPLPEDVPAELVSAVVSAMRARE